MTRLLASEPERLLSHHVRTDAPTKTGLAQMRAVGSAIPIVISGRHYWTTAVVLPPSGSPTIPHGSICPPALREVDWAAARNIAAEGGGYIGRSPVENRGSRATRGPPPSRALRNQRRRRRCRESENLRPQLQPLGNSWRPQNRGSPQCPLADAPLPPTAALPVLRSGKSTSVLTADAPAWEPAVLQSIPEVAED